MHKLAADLRSKNVHTFYRWAPAHAGVEGNEQAHQNAQKGTEKGSTSTTEAWPHQALRVMGTTTPIQACEDLEVLKARSGKFLKRLDQALPGRHTRRLYDGINWDKATILAHLRSGYCRLNGYLHKIKASNTDKCECGKTETV